MSIFRIQIPGLHKTTKAANFVNFECRYRTVADLARALNEGEIVVGHVLITRLRPDTNPPVWEVVERRDAAIGRGGADVIEAPRWAFATREEVNV